MIFNIILAGSAILILILMRVQVAYMTHYKDGYILASSIAYSMADDERIKEISAGLIKNINRLVLIFIPLTLIIFLSASPLIKLWVFFLSILSFMAIYALFLDQAMKEVRAYKRAKKAGLDPSYLDPLAKRRAKEAMPSIFYLLPFIILLPGLIFLDFSAMTPALVLVSAGLVDLGLVFYLRALERSPIIIYSKDPANSTRFGLEKKSSRVKKVLAFSCIFSLLALIASIISYKKPSSYWPIFSCLGLMALGPVLLLIMEAKREGGPKDLNTDDEDYYDVFGYKNPNDERVLVPSKTSLGNMDINRGNTKGRFIFYLVNGLVLILIASIPYFLSPAQYSYRLGEDKIFIAAKIYNDEIDLADIEKLDLLDDFPEGSIVRTNGTSLDSQAYGSFSIQGLGPVRLYYYKGSSKIIRLRAKKTYLFNQKTDEETVKLYKEIKSKLEA